ncbi:MAG: AAA family ATPase [Planctomycetaceae bacterium]|nr:AAA family ATPase [Planctomycetaceae bacterium]
MGDLAISSGRLDPLSAAAKAASPADKLPGWYPAWARELADLYFSGTTCLFILHGNVHDLVHCPEGNEDSYCSLSEFLTTQVFGTWDLVLGYDLSQGLRPQAGRDGDRLRAMFQYLGARWGDPTQWPRDPDPVLLLLDAFIERNLVEDPAARKSVAFLFDYAQYMLPAGGLDSLVRGQGARLVRMLRWAQNPLIKQVNMAFCLVADQLAEVNERLVQCPHVAAIEIPLPDREERRRFSGWTARGQDLSQVSALSADQLADLSNGLTLTNLNVVLSQATRSGRKLDSASFRQLKKTVIERQCQGLVEFIEPDHTLDMVAGQAEAKKRLQDDARLITDGRLDAAPMGYLICGPVGTGKTYMAECYAGSIGIPCVSLKNFRSKYVGETEGNLQQVLAVLRSLGPVVVIIDEADAALGNRETEGDSGTSARVFSMIAAQMGNTHYRGRIVWMLLTSRPDLLPIDLKRQGRAEVHIPLFYPYEDAEIRSMFEVMARKNKVQIAVDALPKLPATGKLSGADIESIVLGAKRAALAAGRNDPSADDLQKAASEFIPSSQGLEKEMQEIAAVLECTQLSLLPPMWREKVSKPDGRSQLQERIAAIRQLMET